MVCAEVRKINKTHFTVRRPTSVDLKISRVIKTYCWLNNAGTTLRTNDIDGPIIFIIVNNNDQYTGDYLKRYGERGVIKILR